MGDWFRIPDEFRNPLGYVFVGALVLLNAMVFAMDVIGYWQVFHI